jgi:hypothetical protein
VLHQLLRDAAAVVLNAPTNTAAASAVACRPQKLGGCKGPGCCCCWCYGDAGLALKLQQEAPQGACTEQGGQKAGAHDTHSTAHTTGPVGTTSYNSRAHAAVTSQQHHNKQDLGFGSNPSPQTLSCTPHSANPLKPKLQPPVMSSAQQGVPYVPISRSLTATAASWPRSSLNRASLDAEPVV